MGWGSAQLTAVKHTRVLTLAPVCVHPGQGHFLLKVGNPPDLSQDHWLSALLHTGVMGAAFRRANCWLLPRPPKSESVGGAQQGFLIFRSFWVSPVCSWARDPCSGNLTEQMIAPLGVTSSPWRGCNTIAEMASLATKPFAAPSDTPVDSSFLVPQVSLELGRWVHVSPANQLIDSFTLSAVFPVGHFRTSSLKPSFFEA